MRTVKQGRTMLREAVQFSSLGAFKTRLNKAPINLTWPWRSPSLVQEAGWGVSSDPFPPRLVYVSAFFFLLKLWVTAIIPLTRSFGLGERLVRNVDFKLEMPACSRFACLGEGRKFPKFPKLHKVVGAIFHSIYKFNITQLSLVYCG